MKKFAIYKMGTGLVFEKEGEAVATVEAKTHSQALKAHFGAKAKVSGRGSNASVEHEGYWNMYKAFIVQ